jgi:hypothetical protein
MVTRDVEQGIVLCPAGGPIPVTECLDCHLLQALEADWRRPDCRTTED